MGNCCAKMCGQQSPCHLTEDETKGLLQSSESKTSTKAGTETCTSPASDEEKWQEETKPALDEAITKQPNAESEILKAQSSYSKTIPILHTEQSLASKLTDNILLETTPTAAGCLATETDVQKIEVQDIQNFAAEASEESQGEIEAPEDDASQAKSEIEGQHGSPEPVPIDKADVSSMSQDLTFAPAKEAPAEETSFKEAPAEEMPVKEASVEETPFKDAPVKEAPAEEMPINEVPVKETPVEETPVKEAPFKEAPAEEIPVNEAPVEETPVKEASAEETPFKEAPAEEIPVKEAPAEEVTVLEAPAEEVTVLEAPMFAQVEAEIKSSEVKPETHVSGKKKMLQIGELTPNVTTEVKQEVSLTPETGEILVTEPDSSKSRQLNHHLDATGESVTKVTCKESTPEVDEKLQQEASETQEYSKQVSSPIVDITNGLSPGVENGLTKDSNNLSTKNKTQVDVTEVEESLKDDAVLKPSEDVFDIANEELSSKPSTNAYSAIQVDTPEVINSVTDQEKNENIAQQAQEATEGTKNGLNSTSASAASSPTEKTRPIEPTSDAVAVETTEVKGEVTALKKEKSLEPRDDEEPEPQQREEEIQKQEEKTEEQKEEYKKQEDEIKTQEDEIKMQEEDKQKEDKQKEKSDVTQENKEKEGPEIQKGGVLFSSGKVEVQLLPVPSEGSVEEVQKLDESADLYLGAEEIEKGASKEKPSSKPVLELTIPGVESRSSLAPAVDILAYSEREWKGNTAKSTLIRKGYSEMSRSFNGLKQVRGDNYCALRATLYQVLANSTNTPTWLQDDGFLSLPETIEAREHLIGGWAFPPECTWGSEKDSVERMIYYLDLFKNKWQAAAACESPEERQSLCDRVFQGGEEEYGLLEALKFLMLAKAIELHGNMVADQEVPVFCWLLFARDTSENPKTLLANHLSQIGFSGGVEQVEMFLLGYALQHTIQAFRLYMTDTVEFVTHYPDDHKHEWPCVCIVTEDDRHYNVPVRTAQHQQGNNITVT